MVFELSGMGVAKIFGFISGTLFLALNVLWPVNDRPTNRTQVLIFLAIDALLFALLFGLIKINIIP